MTMFIVGCQITILYDECDELFSETIHMPDILEDTFSMILFIDMLCLPVLLTY